MQLLKHISGECSEPLSLLINMSLKNGVFPEAMKLANVVPIFKAKIRQMFNKLSSDIVTLKYFKNI